MLFVLNINGYLKKWLLPIELKSTEKKFTTTLILFFFISLIVKCIVKPKHSPYPLFLIFFIQIAILL